MLMSNPAVQPLIEDPLENDRFGIGYRRKLAVGESAPPPADDKADENEIDDNRHTSAGSDKRAGKQKPTEPPAPPLIPTDTPLGRWAFALITQAGHNRIRDCAGHLEAFLECWEDWARSIDAPTFETAWRAWLGRLLIKRVKAAEKLCAEADDEPIADTEHDEQMAMRCGWARDQILRCIWRELHGKPTRDDDKLDKLDELTNELAGHSTAEVSEYLDDLRMARQMRHVERQREKNRQYRDRPEKVDPRQMMLEMK